MHIVSYIMYCTLMFYVIHEKIGNNQIIVSENNNTNN
jgi:hypothetical protein